MPESDKLKSKCNESRTMLAPAPIHIHKKFVKRTSHQTRCAANRLPMTAWILAAACMFAHAGASAEEGPLANNRFEAWLDKVADQPRVRKIRKRFPQASVQLAKRVEGERLSFEVVADDRELAAGFVNIESGKVHFLGEVEQGAREAEERETEEREAEAREGKGFWRAFREACRFPVEGRGLVWFAGAVTLLAVFPFRHPVAMRSLDVLALLAMFPLSLVVWQHKFETYLALFALNGYLLVRCVWRSFRDASAGEWPNLQTPALAGMLLIVTVAHVQAVFTRGPDDSGIWTVFGGQYVAHHHRLPYGQIGEGGTYGPLLYAVAAPLTHVLPPTAPSSELGERIVVDRGNVQRVGYQNCDFLPAKVLALAFAFLLIGGLIAIGQQEDSWQAGLTLALVYAVNGLTIQRDLLFVSHLAPTAFVVLAIAARRRPALSGACLALGASALFWPAFLIPTWLAYYASRGRAALIRCCASIAVIGAATLAAVYLYTEPVKDRGPLAVFVANTWEHQEGGAYGHSKFGLWGQWGERHPERADAIGNIKRAVRWSYWALCLGLPAALYLARRPRPLSGLLGSSAALALGLQFWKTHGGGLYTGWYFPLVVATLFLSQAAARTPPSDQNQTAD